MTLRTDPAHPRTDAPALVEAGIGRMIGAFCVDAAIALAVPIALFIALLGRLGGGFAALVALIAWPLFVAVYGAICGSGRTIGGLVAGTRRQLLPSGRAPGPWRMAWDGLKMYVFGVILILLIILAEGSGNPVPDGTDPSAASDGAAVKDRMRTVRARGR